MKLLEIKEPQKIPEKSQSIAIGIDLGTTNSLVAYSKNQEARILVDEIGERKIPSLVAVTKDHKMLVGNKAKTSYDHDDITVISSIKRLMGKSSKDAKNVPHLHRFIDHSSNADLLTLNIHEKSITPVEISSIILQRLKLIAEKNLNKEIGKAVITVPAYFDEAQRQATQQAAKLAGIEVLRIISEPTAAALAYGLSKGKEGIYVIYDLGGGTFDVSVLKMQKGVFQVLATGGDTNLGGDDIDYLITKSLEKKLGANITLDANAIKHHACNIKEALSKREKIEVVFSVKDKEITISFTREELNNLIHALVDKTISITKQVIRDSDVSLDNIKGIVLVGGSTRIPIVKRKLKKLAEDIHVYDDINPDEIVAIGAAIQAENLTQGSNHLLLDVTPLSLGIELLGGINEKIIQRNTTIPVSVSKEFTTHEDAQTGMILHIVQGEREMAKDCRSLAKLELTNIPPMKSGIARVKVTFIIDADGLLTVTAEEQHTKLMQTVKVMPSYGLKSSEIENMLYDSMQNAAEDVKMKLITESIIHAEQMILKVTDFIKEDRDLLNEQEYRSILLKINDIRKYIKAKDRHSIDNAVNELGKVTFQFIERRIDKHINVALKGLKVDDVDELLIS